MAKTTPTISVCCIMCKKPVEPPSFCPVCGFNFCDTCWDVQLPHRPESASDVEHEKSDPEITARLRGILTPATNPDEQKQLHLDDIDTTWLRYIRPSSLQEPAMLEFPRYKKLMQDSFTSEWHERWPQLVSFIGQTGKISGPQPLVRRS